MTSFGYRLNPRYTIKECLSCGALYTGDFCCSKGNVEDKILVPKPPKNCARCAKCGHLVNGPYCQGCALLREKLEEDLVSYFQNFQNISESSDDSTNVVNAHRDPFVVKQDHGVNPPHIDKCCCECGNALDGIFCQQCTYKVIKSSVEDLVPIPSESEGIPDTMCDVHLVNNPTPLEAKDHFKSVINSNDDISSSDDDSLYNENIEYVEASPHDSELVSLEAAEIVILEVEEIEDDNLREKLLNVHLLIANIEALKDNPTSSSKLLTKSFSTSPKYFVEETNTFDNSLPKFEKFCFDLEEICSGSTTTHSDISLPDYKAFSFNNDHIKEISSGSTTTHSDISLSEYDSFIFDLTHEEFADELAHIISPPEDLPDLVEVSNRGLKSIIERTIGENRASWFEKLDDAFWAFKTAYKTPIGCTPYKLVYEKSCHLPIELEHKAYWALKHVNFDLKTAGDHRKLQLNELNELCDQAYKNSLIYKEKTKKIHDSQIKNRIFNVGDRVLLFNSHLKIFSGKLKTRWSRPFTITKVFPYGTVELSQPDGPKFKVNGHRVKHYFGGDVP
nr:reverse transcriptase domain-containing protein [Tanacetum cinerariifolium]